MDGHQKQILLERKLLRCSPLHNKLRRVPAEGESEKGKEATTAYTSTRESIQASWHGLDRPTSHHKKG